MFLDEIWQFHQGWDSGSGYLARTNVPAGRLKVKVLLLAWAPPSPFTVAIGAPPKMLSKRPQPFPQDSGIAELLGHPHNSTMAH